MKTLYNLSIQAYSLGVKIASLRNEKAEKWLCGRKEVWSILEEKIDKDKEYIWVHCASLGEFEQGRPVVEKIKEKDPNLGIVVTFFSPSGYEVRKNYEYADIVCYLPVDTKKNASRFLDIVNPRKALFVKYEFWYHYLMELTKRSIPTFIFSAIFRDSQLFFKPYGKWFRKMLSCYEHLFVQNEESERLLNNIGIKNVTVAGDTRFDRVCQIASLAENLSVMDQFCGDQKVVVAGSTWEPDEDLLIHFINNRDDQTKWVIAPHEVSDASIARIQDKLTKKAVRFSSGTPDEFSDAKVLIADGYGYLTSIYRYGKLAYVGGGFGVGIHNILEAATFGMPIVIGPNHKKFQEACELKKRGGVFSISNQEEFSKKFDKFLDDPIVLREASHIARQYVVENKGASSIILDYLF